MSDVALDGAEFLDALTEAAKNATPLLADQVLLQSSESLSVVRDQQVLRPYAPAGKWEKQEAAFDFLVEWTVTNDERAKSFAGEFLKIAVSEDWMVRKVADPSVMKM